MPAPTTAGVYMLAPEHADALQRFASDPSFAALIGAAGAPALDVAATFIDRASDERGSGAAVWSVVVDRNDVKGVAAVIGPYDTDPRIQVWIHPAVRGCGYGALALRMTLELAFRNLRLQRVFVVSNPDDAASTTLLDHAGFSRVRESAAASPNAARWSLTRPAWIAHRDRPALAALHPDLRAILDAELAAGNEVLETGGGWPDADSVFIRLRDPFRTKPQLPDGITYTEPNDPHWWKADYSSRSPRHVLAC